jgi:HD-GYP domain-containing protein (c-di-GMP phosphodiesterase class II)
VHQPAAAAFRDVQRMLMNVALAALVLLAFAALFAAVAARLLARPIQRLADTSHEIAAGNFSKRVEVEGPGVELANLAHDFNRMSTQIQAYVGELQKAASANRDLFISSIRAFAAAIDAKDPYTRGHSERVAALSRTIARQLLLPEEMLTRAWIGGVLHDVGKIGIDDRILKKGGVLTAAEYTQMKLHPTIGADILAPIEQLREMIPAIRWHHESWNGRGYPEGLKGEQIPLLARIVAVADSFDAITTSRPYQRAYAPDFAVETIIKLAGSRFDAKVVTAFLRAFEAGEVEVHAEAAEPMAV